ncbi:hypothetical protein OIU84_022155 [Salix udensis]|uniref:Uncharacterized protein n=1 Tax=Salix udensis TaxID=889485 RepID=A0AAD6KN39_9ROSI|nr:hypothetical protein OIU84_022155 [Salix udensis]
MITGQPRSDELVQNRLLLSRTEAPDQHTNGRLWPEKDHNSELYPENSDELAGFSVNHGTRRGSSCSTCTERVLDVFVAISVRTEKHHWFLCGHFAMTSYVFKEAQILTWPDSVLEWWMAWCNLGLRAQKNPGFSLACASGHIHGPDEARNRALQFRQNLPDSDSPVQPSMRLRFTCLVFKSMSNRGRAGLVGNIVTDQKRQSRLIGVLLSSCWRHGQRSAVKLPESGGFPGNSS